MEGSQTFIFIGYKNTMLTLSQCLQSNNSQILNFPENVNHPVDSVKWALDMFSRYSKEADMQFRETSDHQQDSELLYFNQQDPDTFEHFQKRILTAKPVHGSLPLIDFCAGDGTFRKNASWAWDIFNAHFGNALNDCHPLGSYVRATMWMSCGEHVYDAHCDPFDGFLFHMAGRKRVRVWPLPDKYREDVVFNHSDFEGRMASEPTDYDLEPGQVLFIPTGAMHEVISLGSEPSVSVSFHMGSPFPMEILCMHLNKLLNGGSVSLPNDMKSINKFEMYFFEPTRFHKKSNIKATKMPTQLKDAITRILLAKNVTPAVMEELLNTWWQIATSQIVYQGPYPERLVDYHQ